MDILERVASDFEAAVKFAATDFVEVLEVRVELDLLNKTLSLTLLLEADGDEELDEVADRVLDRAFATLDDPDESDELNVVESALIPA